MTPCRRCSTDGSVLARGDRQVQVVENGQQRRQKVELRLLCLGPRASSSRRSRISAVSLSRPALASSNFACTPTSFASAASRRSVLGLEFRFELQLSAANGAFAGSRHVLSCSPFGVKSPFVVGILTRPHLVKFVFGRLVLIHCLFLLKHIDIVASSVTLNPAAFLRHRT